MSPRDRSVAVVTDSQTIPTTPSWNVPEALLLDFGGVIFQTRKDPAGKRRLARALVARLARAGIVADLDRVHSSIEAGLTALKHWKHAQSRRRLPRELQPREIVGDFLVADLDDASRALLTAEASDVLLEVTTTLSTHEVRPGIRELLDLADAHGIPVGIVSNAHSGRSHRAVLAEHGLADRFAVQCYSDEVGLRKPHPGIIELAAEACGTTPDRCWYVGDTQDRDVVAGRRAGVAAVILTRSAHTDAPPFAVDATADAVYATPEGLAGALRDALAAGNTAAPMHCLTHDDDTLGRALLIDHGGVISLSVDDHERVDAFAAWLSRLLAGPEAGPDPAEVTTLIARARLAHGAFKREATRRFLDDAAPLAEADPVVFWRDWFGGSLSARQRAVLKAEAHDVMARYGRAKSRRSLRAGVRELLETCRAERVPVVVVSNTVSGRAVRAECAAHGIDHLIAASVCSDEAGVRKPDASLVREALVIARADPARTWFLGDKPQNDAVAARAAGIAHRVIVRGGSTADADVDAALTTGLATHAVDEPGDLVSLISAVPAAASA